MGPILFFTGFLSIAFQACVQPDYLVIGKGGGITGEVLQYRISPKGKVYKGTGLADIQYTLAGKIKRSDARKLFDEIKSIPDSSFHHPGNVYYFIRKAVKNSPTEYTWGANGFEVPESIKTLYKNTMNRISDLTFKPVKKPVE